MNPNIPSNSSRIARLVDAYAEAQARAKEASETADALRAKILDLGDGTYIGTNHKVVVSTSVPVRFDSTAFKEAHPTLYDQFRRQGDPVSSARIYGR